MTFFAHHAASPMAPIESDTGAARHVAVLALLWAVAILVVVAATALGHRPQTESAPAAAPEAADLVPLGA